VAFLDPADLKTLYNDSKTEAHEWRSDYPAYERLMNNDLMEGLDPNLPEVNDGSLSAALFKLPKRVYKPLTGSVKAVNRDEAWLSELAQLQWRNEIIPNANTQAPFDRKWKDGIRKAAGYGSVPLITLQVERDGKTYTDFIVAQPQDVTLEPGKVSDYDSDVVFWDVYYTKLQLQNMIEQARAEEAEGSDSDSDSYNTWDIPAMELILESNNTEERSSLDTPRSQADKNTKPKGFKFCVVFQRGANAPFYMYHKETDSVVREWTNPDPSGDIPVHFLYCYQDFINPYGIGIVKLAGGTQNVLDYMRQADVLATQLGLRPPLNISGDTTNLDVDSLVYAQDAMWFTGSATVQREELTNGVYKDLPGRIQMYKTSLNQLIPMGDTSATAAQSGDPTQSKTPAGVKLQAANLSIDDEDFKDNLYVTYEAVAKSMINTHFANMEGTDLMKLTDDERDLLMKGGLQFPQSDTGEVSNQLEIQWDTVRAQFNFTVDPEQDKATDDAQKLQGLQLAAEILKDPSNESLVQQGSIILGTKKVDTGELLSEIINLATDNDKIVTDVSPEEKQQNEQSMAAGQQSQKSPSESVTFKDAVAAGAIDSAAAMLEQAGLPADDIRHQGQINQAMQAQAMAQPETPAEQSTDMGPEQPQEGQEPSHGGVSQSEIQANVDAVMQQYGVDETTALTALAAEHQGFPAEDVIAHLQSLTNQGAPA